MVAVAVVQVLGLILTKTPETLVGLVVAVAVELAFLLDLVVQKMLVDMEIVVKERTYLTKLEEEKQVVMQLLMLVEMVVMVVIMEKVEEKLETEETVEIEMMHQQVVVLEVQIEVEEEILVTMGMV